MDGTDARIHYKRIKLALRDLEEEKLIRGDEFNAQVKVYKSSADWIDDPYIGGVGCKVFQIQAPPETLHNKNSHQVIVEPGHSGEEREIAQHKLWCFNSSYWCDLHSRAIDEKSDDSSTTAPQLARFLIGNMRPFDINLFYILGHGDEDEIARMPIQEITDGLRIAREDSGVKPNAIILECCNGATVNTLGKLAGRADIAIASEDMMENTGIPVDKMIQRLPITVTSKKEMAEIMLSTLNVSCHVNHAVAVGLETTGLLSKFVDELLFSILRGPALAEEKEKIQLALMLSKECVPVSADFRNGFGDLGNFAEFLQRASSSAAIKTSAQIVLDQLKLSRIAHFNRAGHPVISGISFNADDFDARLQSA